MKTVILISILTITILGSELITPLPFKTSFNKEKALLGKKLFSDTILSRDRTISCESCHNLKKGGADRTPVSFGVESRIGRLNSPTVFNSLFNFKQFWDGRADDLNEQVPFPIQDYFEMDLTLEDAVKRVHNNGKYREVFENIYSDGVTSTNIADAIAEFEKTLITPNSKFDQYLIKKTMLSERELEGYNTFKSKGCISCHHGINIGGNMFQKFGAVIERNDTADGRFNVTKREKDRHFFKVPSLRNITETAPYFHDGKTASLKEAIVQMAYHQLGIYITDYEVESIEAFFKTLKGDYPNILKEKDIF